MAFVREESAGYLINIMARMFARHLEVALRPLGLGPGSFPALLFLWEKDGLTQKELAEMLGIEQPTMANTLARMERDGLITRRRDAQDARAQHIWLTKKSKALQAPAHAAAQAVNARALKGMTDGERESFVLQLRVVMAGLTGP